MAAETPAIWQQEVRGDYPDPAVIALSGRERLQGWRRRTSPPPPLSHLTGAVPVAFGDGTAEAEMPASGWLASSTGVISGGALAIVADIAFGCSIETQLPAATTYTTAELSMSFLRPTRPGTALTAHGQAIHVGRSVALSEVFVLDRDSERLVAHGTSRLSVFPPLPDPPEPPTRPPVFEPRDYGSPDPFERPPPASVIPQEVWSELAGAEVLRRQLAGELPAPPLHHLTGLRLTEVGEGSATFTLPATEWLASPARRLQGGVIAMQADFAMLAATETMAGPGVAIAGLDLKANFLRPVAPDGTDLTARAEVVHSGRTIAITRAEVANAEGKPVLLATGSSMYLPGRPASLGEVELGPHGE
ncbi:MAG TPA: hotdog fold thioesterase [Solirubrobacterales bacterium]